MKRFLVPLLGGLAGLAGAAEPATPAAAIAAGKFSLNLRLRYESVEQTGLRDADALTLRTRLGFAPAPWQGFKAFIEAEDVTAADGDSYSQSGLNPGGAGRAVIADPVTTELNQLFLAYTRDHTTVTVGRQRLVLDNARFIGDVGWRQNMQTFDAVVLQDQTLGQTTLTYAYLSQVNRVFGDRHPQGKWSSHSQLFNGSYRGWSGGTLTGYVYLLDFPNAAANSCATTGVSLAGSLPATPQLKFTYRVELATQSDYGSSPLAYTARYHDVEAGFTHAAGSLALGDERLGSDHNVGFKTPLATLHAFNGWADLFLATPAGGLDDRYLRATANLPGAVALVSAYHWYASDVNAVDLGREFNLQLSRKLTPALTALVKFADFRHESAAFPDVQKSWVQLEYVF
ncbi:MAG: alginate export family protein [Verrucomicrobia bacterium]|nr:alginate export family protein [Verrucomicrobiota bacterium]